MAIKALSVTATGAGTAVRAHGADKYELQVSFSNAGGSCTALVILLQGTNNNKALVDAGTAKWDTLGTKTFSSGELSAALGTLSVVNVTPEFVRPYATVTDTGTTTVSGWLSATRGSVKVI